MIATEILIPEALFRQMQQRLDTFPQQSFDALCVNALVLYLSFATCPYCCSDRSL
jgi:hypothetical protein